MDLSTTYLGLKLLEPADAGGLAPRRRDRHGEAARGRGRVDDHDALSLRGADRPRAGGDVHPHRGARPVVRRGDDVLPEPGVVPPRARRVPRPPAQGEAGRLGAGRRLAERLLDGGLARVREAHRAGRRRRARAERLHARQSNAAGVRRADRAAHGADGAGRPQGRPHPRGREALAVLHLDGPLRVEARRGRRRRPRALQPVLPARHRRRGAAGAPAGPPVELGGAAAAARLARAPVAEAEGLARLLRRRPHRRSTSCRR